MRHRLVTILVAVLVLVAALPLLAVYAVDAGYFHAALLRLVSAQMQRDVDAESLQLSLFGQNPSVVARKVTIGNPPWSSPGTMAHIERLELHFRPLFGSDHSLTSLVVQKADLDLKRDERGRANWQRINPDAGTGGPLPLLRHLEFADTRLKLDDERLHLRFEGPLKVDSDGKLHVELHGRLNDHEAELSLEGDALEGVAAERPYGFRFEEHSSGSRLSAQGSLPHPFDLDAVDASFEASGADLRDLYNLVGASLPNTGAYKLSGKVERRGLLTRFDPLSVTTGQSDASGTLALKTQENDRTLLTADFKFQRLRAADLGLKAAGRDPNPNAPPKLFSDVPLISDATRRVDSVVRVKIARLAFARVELKGVSAELKIDRGRIEVKDFAASMWDGQLKGQLQGDANPSPPTETVELRLLKGQLAQFKRPDGSAPWDGPMDARIRVSGHGISVEQLAASADGEASAFVPQGGIREAFAELAGVDLRGIGLTLSKNDRDTPVRCAGAKFTIRAGLMTSDTLLIDSEKVLIRGAGTVALGPEALDLTLNGQPKSLRILRMQTPVKVTGTLLQPKFSVAKDLGALKLIDSGKGQDVDCRSLAQQTD